MRIENNCIEDFIEVLKGYKDNSESQGSVLHNIVYMQKDLEPLNGADPRSATAHLVSLRTSCVVVCSDSTEVLVVAEEECGVDRKSDGGQFEGTQRLKVLKEVLQEYCGQQGYTILPGNASPV